MVWSQTGACQCEVVLYNPICTINIRFGVYNSKFEPPTQLTGTNIEEQIKETKEADGGDIITFGSPTLVQSLTKEERMRKLIVIEFITLDGVIQAPGGSEEDTAEGFRYGGWMGAYTDDFLGNVMDEQMSGRSDLLLGRKTYDIFAGYWPQHADGWPGINEVKKYVASHDSTLKLDWENSVLLAGNVVEEVKKLKSGDGTDLQVWGSGNLIQALLKHDLVDELWLKIFPITLGSGKKLFVEGTIPAAFKLTDGKISPKGVIVANYERAGEVQTESFS
jgi:dihydrofolate reductase